MLFSSVFLVVVRVAIGTYFPTCLVECSATVLGHIVGNQEVMSQKLNHHEKSLVLVAQVHQRVRAFTHAQNANISRMRTCNHAFDCETAANVCRRREVFDIRVAVNLR